MYYMHWTFKEVQEKCFYALNIIKSKNQLGQRAACDCFGHEKKDILLSLDAITVWHPPLFSL